jgi:hypothetical protein
MSIEIYFYSMEVELKKKLLVFGLVAAALWAVPTLSAQNPGTLRDVTFSQAEGKTVFVIKVDGEFTYESSLLTMPRRLVIDLTPVEKIDAPPFLQVNASGVISVRTGLFKPQTVRVVFDLNDQNSSQSVSASQGGLVVSFGLEGDKPAAAEPERTAPVREIPRQEVRPAASEPASRSDERPAYFVRVGAGLDIFLKPNLTTRFEFPLYGETGAVDETYNLKSGLAIEGSFGHYFHLLGFRLKAGVGFTYWNLPLEGAFTLTLPNPFLANTPRTVSFAETSGLKKNEVSFYAFALFPLMDTERFSIFLGPFVGYASGKFLTLNNWDITEKAPFTSADVTVSNPTYFEDTISELLYGAELSLELNLGRSLAVVLDTKLNYLNPIVTNIGKRANLLNLQPTLGIQFSF